VSIPVQDLQQASPLPASPRPIAIFGAGGIVNDAHLPAYRPANLPVAGGYDKDHDRARTLAKQWGLRAFATPEQAVAVAGVLFDFALPPAAHLDVLPMLPEGTAVLLQKPMGRRPCGGDRHPRPRP
jgi:predicted dehydrogenase